MWFLDLVIIRWDDWVVVDLTRLLGSTGELRTVIVGVKGVGEGVTGWNGTKWHGEEPRMVQLVIDSS